MSDKDSFMKWDDKALISIPGDGFTFSDNSKSATIIFPTNCHEVVRIAKDGFYFRGVKLELDETEKRTLFDAMLELDEAEARNLFDAMLEFLGGVRK